MTVGVSYSFFDSEELLSFSVDSIREKVDYVNVVFQEVSNHGNKATNEAKELLLSLYKDKKVDDIIIYNPNLSISPSINELNKRNLGLYKARERGLSHFMCMDADEFYDTNEFLNAKEQIIKNDYDATVCTILNYFKEPTIRFDKIDNYYVPFIYKIRNNTEFILNCPFPVLADPTRKMPAQNFYAFKEEEVVMHHFSYVRKNILNKLTNSSARVNFDRYINQYVEYYNNWQYGDSILSFDMTPKDFKVIRVDNKFNIKL